MTQNPWGGQPQTWEHRGGHPSEGAPAPAKPWGPPPPASQPYADPRQATAPQPQRYPHPSAQSYLGPRPQQAPAWGGQQPWGAPQQQPGQGGASSWPAPQQPQQAAGAASWPAPQPQGPNAPYGSYSAPYVARPPSYGQPGSGAYFPAPTTQPYYPGPQSWNYPAPAAPRRKNNWLIGIVAGVLAFLLLAGLGMLALRVMSPTEQPTLGPSTSSTATPSEWANDGYKVPEPDANPSQLPYPESDSQAETWNKENTLYNQAVVTPIRCEVKDIDITTASNTELTQHVNDEVACLMRSWSVPVEGAGFTLYRPLVTVYENSVTTKCGKTKDGNAFYCSGDQQIYYARNAYEVLPDSLQKKRWMIEAIIAHEFGHAVQARVGISTATHSLQRTVPKAKQNQLNRNLELQADCFAGTFLQSVSKSTKMAPDETLAIKQMFYEIGDDIGSGEPNIDGDHGHGANRARWFEAGLNAKTYSACNTYTAAADQTA